MANKLLTNEKERESERLREEIAQLRRENEEAKGLREEITLLRREMKEMKEEKYRALMGPIKNTPPPSPRIKKRAPPSSFPADDPAETSEGRNSPPQSPPKKVPWSELPETCRPSLQSGGKKILAKEGELVNDASPGSTREIKGITQWNVGHKDSGMTQRMDRLEKMMGEMMKSMKRLETQVTQSGERAQSGNRARENAPVTVPPQGTTREHPVPEAGKGERGRRGGRKQEGNQPPKTSPSAPTPQGNQLLRPWQSRS